MNWKIIKSTAEEIELIDNKLGDFNKTQVDYTSKMDYLPLYFNIKDEQSNIIAGINALTVGRWFTSVSYTLTNSTEAKQ